VLREVTLGAMDELLDRAAIARLRASVESVGSRREAAALARAERAVQGLPLRRRVDLVRDALLEDVPAGFPSASTVVQSLLEDSRFGGWMIWPTSEFLTTRALESGTTADFDAAMELLSRLTVDLTGEFAVRSMLIARPERSLAVMQTWTAHESEHVRRLATEGSRPYLPWAKRVPWLLTHPRATRGLLDATYRDPSAFVRRSVANHLNDLSRVEPAVATTTAADWAVDADENAQWVIRHGLRTLVKAADPHALVLLGYTGDQLDVSEPSISRSLIPWSGELAFTAVVANRGDTEANVAIDYSIGFQRADGSVRPKTFKLGSRRLAPGASVVVGKTHSFHPITTRRYYPGAHHVTVQANGAISPPAKFTLSEEFGEDHE